MNGTKIFIDFAYVFHQAFKHVVKQQKIKYFCNGFQFSINHYNILIDTILGISQYIDNCINVLRTTYPEANIEIYNITDYVTTACRYTKGYDAMYYKKHKKSHNVVLSCVCHMCHMIALLDIGFKEMINYENNVMNNAIEEYKQTFEINRYKYNATKKIQKGKVIETIENYINDNVTTFDEYLPKYVIDCYFSKTSRYALKIIRYNKELINDLIPYCKNKYESFWKKHNLNSNAFVSKKEHSGLYYLIGLLKKDIFFLQNRLTKTELCNIYKYLFNRCTIRKTDNITFDKNNKYIIISNKLAADSAYNKTFDIHYNIITKQIRFSTTYPKKINSLMQMMEQYTMKDLIEDVNNQCVLNDNDSNIIFKHIVTINRYNLDLFFDYDQDFLFKNTHEYNISDENLNTHVDGYIKFSDKCEYIDNISYLIERYKYDNFSLI